MNRSTVLLTLTMVWAGISLGDIGYQETSEVEQSSVKQSPVQAAPAGCKGCDERHGLQKSVSVAKTNRKTQVHKIDCVRIDYEWEMRKKYIPQQVKKTEYWEEDVIVPVVKHGVRTENRTKLVPRTEECEFSYKKPVCVRYPIYDKCGNFCRWGSKTEWRTFTGTTTKTVFDRKDYKVDVPYSWTEQKKEKRVRSRKYTDVEYVEVDNPVQVAKFVADARYVVEHKIEVTKVYTYSSDLPKKEGAERYRQQQAGQVPDINE